MERSALLKVLKPRVQHFLDAMEFGQPQCAHIVEALVDPLEALVDLLEALINPLEAVVDPLEALVDPLEVLVDSVKLSVDVSQ